MTRSRRWLFSGLAAAACAVLLPAAGCGGDGDTIGTRVVVQETNVPNDPPPPCPDSTFHYTVSIEQDCGGVTMATVCADQVLCQNQIDAAVAPLASCDQLMGYDIDVPATCE